MSNGLSAGRLWPGLPGLDLITSQTRLIRLIKARDLAEFDVFDPDPRHVGRDERARKSAVEAGILTLT